MLEQFMWRHNYFVIVTKIIFFVDFFFAIFFHFDEIYMATKCASMFYACKQWLGASTTIIESVFIDIRVTVYMCTFEMRHIYTVFWCKESAVLRQLSATISLCIVFFTIYRLYGEDHASILTF